MKAHRVIRALGVVALVGTAACFPTVDTSGLEPIDDYQTWFSVETRGPIPAHADTIRLIYINDEALESQTEFDPGSVLIKEIYKLDEGERGVLDYFAIMRKLSDGTEPDGAELNGGSEVDGWMFTMIDGDDINGDEIYFDRCWTTCHVAAPYDGTFLDY